MILYKLLLGIFLVVLFQSSSSAESKGLTNKPDVHDATISDVWHKAMRKAAEATGTENKDSKISEPRIIARNGKPEIILRRGEILFNGKQLKLGQTVSDWEKILPGNRRCDRMNDPSVCVWDDLGISVGFNFPKPKKITFVTIYLRFKAPDVYDSLVTELPDGSPIKKVTLLQPVAVYPGYIELDGYGIDNNTKLWEVLKKADAGRKIHCGLRECALPSGAFGKNTSIFFNLDEPTETGLINSVQVSTTDNW